MAIGERLRGEREARQVSLEEISATTGIAPGKLEALEANAFNALPGRAKFYIRAYARTLGFDPRQMIDQYDRELVAMGPAPPAPSEPERSAPRPVEAAIARWRKAAMASHARTETADRDDFDHDDEPDHEVEADAIECAEPHVRRPEAEPPPQQPLRDDEPIRVPYTPVESAVREEFPPVTLAAEPRAEAATRDECPPEAPVPQTPIPSAASEHTWEPEARAFQPHPKMVAKEPVREWEPRGVPPHIAHAPPSRSRARVAASLMVGLIVVLAGIRLIVFKTNADGGEPAPIAAAPVKRAPLPVSPPIASDRGEDPTPAMKPPAAPLHISERAVPPGALTVTESGVGSRIVNRRLADNDDTFAPGDVVWFSTRVLGGNPGQRIRHVWLHEGRVQQSIPLKLGARDWRTHSRKTIWAAGAWTVEARDEEGQVLAEASFTCAGGSRS